MKTTLISKTVGVGEFEGKTAEQMIVYCARVSSSREDKFDKPEGLLNHCIKHGHWSIFDQVNIDIEIETSKAIAIQILRHWSIKPQELSQRYADVLKSNNGSLIELHEARLQADDNRQSSTISIAELKCRDGIYYFEFKEGITKEQKEALRETSLVYNLSETAYRNQLLAGISRETARFVLPIATKTKLNMNGSCRSWIHFLQVRDDEHAQKEIQLIAKEIKEIFKKEFPIISKALGWI